MKDFLYFQRADGGTVYLDPEEIEYLETDIQSSKRTRIHMKTNHFICLSDELDEVIEMIDDFFNRRAAEERKKVRDDILKNNDEYWDNFLKRFTLGEKTEKMKDTGTGTIVGATPEEMKEEESNYLIEAARTIGKHCRSKKYCAGCPFYNDVAGCVLMDADSPDEWGL